MENAQSKDSYKRRANFYLSETFFVLLSRVALQPATD